MRAQGADSITICRERRLQPLHAGWFHADHIKAARRQLSQPLQVVARGKNNAALFECADAGRCAAVRVAFALAHFDKHQGAAGRLHDQINLAAAAPRRSIIAYQQAQASSLQMRQGQRLGGIAGLFGGAGSAGLGPLRRLVFFKGHGVQEFISVPLASAVPALAAHIPAHTPTHVPGLHLALAAAHSACALQQHPAGALYVVATPIGNLADISLRALHVLALADCVACEDTRHTASLLRAYGIDKTSAQLLALHQHNEAQAAQSVVERLQRGQRVAYVSDAGTPAISDPGARLVAVVRAAGLRVVPLPGASSVTAALCAAGLASHEGDGADGFVSEGFVFVGFLSSKAQARAAAALALAQEPRAVVLLEAPHRIEPLAQALAVLGARPITVARELTKQFEEIATVAAQDFSAWLAAQPQRTRGEFVLVLHPAPVARAKDGAERVLTLLLAELPLKTAVKLAAEITGQARNALYQQALALKGSL